MDTDIFMMTDTSPLSSQTAILIKKNFTQLETWPKKGYFMGSKKGFFLETIIIICIPMCIWGFFGNGTIFWLLCTRTKRTRFTIYVLNLVIADLIVVIYYIIAFSLFLTSTYPDLYFSRLMENVYLIGYNSSIYFLTAISAERFLMVFIPVCYYHHRPKHLSGVVCAILWLLSCLVSIAVYVACFPGFLSSHHRGSFPCDATVVFEIIVNLLIFFPIMFFSAVALFIRMQRKAKEGCSERLDVTITVIVILYLFFVFSVRIINATAYLDPRLDAPVPFLFSLLSDAIKSGATPFVYIFVGCCHSRITVALVHQFLAKALACKIKKSSLHTTNKKRALRVSWSPEVN
ncbi:LOW QUALITY PROTEIN: proto-oncogene Mas-like [Sceloporus undulatus]|uniref:LOW QUALITY PROTEIN: proto-oncogene Mas-like n=1 Tax=Sceloporus undulatus TaxID=8520 RepID=UPI001C4C4AB2|nr:LOW QUALITY PROTEIN: proto-oncogene Mas-like [Sceloporus undulatus]